MVEQPAIKLLYIIIVRSKTCKDAFFDLKHEKMNSYKELFNLNAYALDIHLALLAALE